ncbi:MAG: hypothetical protein RR290_00945 [Clostridia bacterium]
MKITDFALIFIGITLPIIIVVYVNVSFTIKAVEEEMYYQKLVDSALQDASIRMKEVESEDPENDYGYSGQINNKVSINAQVAADTFFNSFSNNLNIKGNKDAELFLKYFVPAIAVIDYNGVYISSIEEFDKNGQKVIDHVVHPKRYFSFTYGIDNNAAKNDQIITDVKTIQDLSTKNGFSIHTVEFTMDDYVTHRGKQNIGINSITYVSKGFYISDSKNNSDLYDGNTGNKDAVETLLKNKRKEIIIDIITKELNYAVNKHNHYARLAKINYAFSFPYTTKDEMYRYVEDIGMLAFVQGISVGNKYLNYKSYGGSNIELTTKYYISIPNVANGSKYIRNLYHKDINCPEYKVSDKDNITPRFVGTKQQASSLKASLTKGGISTYIQGFYPCPLCRP